MRNTLLGLSLLFGGGTVAAFQPTVIPCGINGNTTSSCTITATNQMVTLSRSVSTTSATITSSLAARRVDKVVVPAYQEKYWLAPFQDIGPLALPDYDGSGLCGRCDPPENDQYVQAVTVAECSSNAKQSTKVCRQYIETWSRRAEGANAPCTLTASTRYPAPSAGTYTFTFYGTAAPTYTVVPPQVTTITLRNGRTTYKIGRPQTIWYEAQPYNVEITKYINRATIINIQTRITTIISVFLPTTTVTATKTVTFTNTGPVSTTAGRTTSATPRRTTTTVRGPTTTSVRTSTNQPTTIQSTAPTATPQQFYIEVEDPNSNELYYIKFVNNQAVLVSGYDAIYSGADTFNLTYGFLQNLNTAQNGGIGNDGTFLVGTSANDGTAILAQFPGFPRMGQWDLVSLPGGFNPNDYYISGLNLRGAQSFCADSQNNVYAVYSTRSSSCVRTITLTAVRRIRGASGNPTTTVARTTTRSVAVTTSASTTVSVSPTTSGPTASPTSFYVQAVNAKDGTVRYVRFNGPYAYLISPSEALGGDNAAPDAEPVADYFDVDDDGSLRSYGAYIGTPSNSNGSPVTRYNRRPTRPQTFTINPDGTMTLNGATSFCADSNGALLTNYDGTSASACRDPIVLRPVSRIARVAATTSSSAAVTTPSTTPATTPVTTASTTPATTPVTTASTTPATTSVDTASTTPATTPVTIASTTPVTTPVTTPSTTPATTPLTTPSTTPSMTVPTTASTTASATPTGPPANQPFYIRAVNPATGAVRYIKFVGDQATLVTASQALGGAGSDANSTGGADQFTIAGGNSTGSGNNTVTGSLFNGFSYVGVSGLTNGSPLKRFPNSSTSPGVWTLGPDGTLTLNGASSLYMDSNSDLLVNFNQDPAAQGCNTFTFSAVYAITDDSANTTTSGTLCPATMPMTTSATTFTPLSTTPALTTPVTTTPATTGPVITTTASTTLSVTTSPAASATPFYIYAVDPSTGQRKYLRRRGNTLVPVDPSQDQPDQYLIDSQGYLGTAPANGTGNGNATSPSYVYFNNKNGSQPFLVSDTRPTPDMAFTVGPDGQLSMMNETSYCYTSDGGIQANFDGYQNPACTTPVQLFSTFAVMMPPMSTTTTTLMSTTSVAVNGTTTSPATTTTASTLSTTSDAGNLTTTTVATTTSSLSVTTSSLGGTGTCTPGACTTTITSTLAASTTTTTITVTATPSTTSDTSTTVSSVTTTSSSTTSDAAPTVSNVATTSSSTTVTVTASTVYVTVTTVYRGTGTLTPDPSTTTLVTADGVTVTTGTVQIIYNPRTTTITSLTSGTGTRTETEATQNGATSGTVEVFIPSYVYRTTTSGNVGSTTILTSASGTVQGSGLVVIPTPDVTCGNRGLQYAIQSNPYQRGLAAQDPTYAAFAAQAFQTERPQATGVTNYLEVPFISRDSSGSIYGNPTGPGAQYLGVNHRGYIFAKESGIYNFQFENADDIALLWLGSKAYGPYYSRSNADITQLYNGAATSYDQQRYVFNITLIQGSYTPMRVLYANAGYDARFLLQIYAPDGELITNGTNTNSPYLVQYSCDGRTAPMYPAWGTESSVRRTRRTKK